MSKIKNTIPVKTGERLELTVEDLASSGDGICKHHGYTLFLPGCITGDRVVAEISNVTPRFGVCKTLQMLSPSPMRREPPCSLFYRCGGCQLQDLSYEDQAGFKVRVVRDAIERIAKISLPQKPLFVPASDPLYYRNKGMFPLSRERKRIKIGYYARRSHELINVRECPVVTPPINRIKEGVRKIIEEFQPPIYDEDTGKGLLRHLVIRGSMREKEFLIGLVTTSGSMDKKMIREIAALNNVFADDFTITGIVQNINPRKTNAIMGRENKTVWGRDFFYERVGDIRYRVSLPSFFQANTVQTEQLNEVVRELLTGENGPILDAYCGAGSIALCIAAQGNTVVGVETNEEAVRDAVVNAGENGIHTCTFTAGSVEEFMEKKGGEKFSAVILDPPRKGCSPQVIDALLTMRPKKIVYVSCSPATLARDLHRLCDQAYTLREIKVIDMFPQTVHMECVAALEMK